MSITQPTVEAPRPARSGGAWRIAVIGTVTVLAVAIGFALSSFLTGSRAAAVGAGADYVPAGAPFYVEVQLQPSAEQDVALRELLGRFPPIDGLDLDRPLADQLSELLDDELAGEELDLSWSDDVAPWTDGRLAIAILELPPAAFDPMAGPSTEAAVPSMVVMLGVTDPDAARTTVARVVEGTGTDFTTSEHRGVTIHASAEGEGAYAITDDQLLAAPAAEDIVAALDAQAGGQTLAEEAQITALTDTLAADWLAFGLFDFTDAMATALEAAGDGSAAIGRLLEHQSLRSAFTVVATDDGLRFEVAGTPPTGPFAVENADRGLAAEVPADALYFSEGGNIGPALEELIGAFKESAATEPEAAEQITMAEAALGAELEELVSWIDDGAMAIGWDGSEPYGGLVLRASDADAAQRRFDQLATFARLAAMDASTGITVDETELDGVTVTTLRWEDPAATGEMFGGGPTSISLQYAQTDGRVLVGVGERFVGRVLELEPADSLSTVERYADAVADLGGPESTGTTWIDVAGIVDAVEEAAGPMLGTDGDEIFAWLRPLDRIVGVARLDGELLLQHSVVLVR